MSHSNSYYGNSTHNFGDLASSPIAAHHTSIASSSAHSHYRMGGHSGEGHEEARHPAVMKSGRGGGGGGRISASIRDGGGPAYPSSVNTSTRSSTHLSKQQEELMAIQAEIHALKERRRQLEMQRREAAIGNAPAVSAAGRTSSRTSSSGHGVKEGYYEAAADREHGNRSRRLSETSVDLSTERVIRRDQRGAVMRSADDFAEESPRRSPIRDEDDGVDEESRWRRGSEEAPRGRDTHNTDARSRLVDNTGNRSRRDSVGKGDESIYSTKAPSANTHSRGSGMRDTPDEGRGEFVQSSGLRSATASRGSRYSRGDEDQVIGRGRDEGEGRLDASIVHRMSRVYRHADPYARTHSEMRGGHGMSSSYSSNTISPGRSTRRSRSLGNVSLIPLSERPLDHTLFIPSEKERRERLSVTRNAYRDMKEAMKESWRSDTALIGGFFLAEDNPRVGTFGRARRFTSIQGRTDQYHLATDVELMQESARSRSRPHFSVSNRGKSGCNVNSHWNDTKGGSAPGPGAYTPRYQKLAPPSILTRR